MCQVENWGNEQQFIYGRFEKIMIFKKKNDYKLMFWLKSQPK